MHTKVIIENDLILIRSFRWKLSRKVDHVNAVVTYLHQLMLKDFDYFHETLDQYEPQLEYSRRHREEYVSLIQQAYHIYESLSHEDKTALHLGAIYHDFYYTLSEVDHRNHGALAVMKVQDELERKGYSESIISNVADAVKYHGATSDFGTHLNISELLEIKDELFPILKLIDIFDCAARKDKTGKDANRLDLVSLEHILSFSKKLIPDPAKYYLYRLKNLCAPFPFGLLKDPKKENELISQFNTIPAPHKEKIIRFLNIQAVINSFPLTKDLYEISQQLLGANNYTLFFKNLFLMTHLASFMKGEVVIETTQEPNFMSLPQEKKIELLTELAKKLNQLSYKQISEYQPTSSNINGIKLKIEKNVIVFLL